MELPKRRMLMALHPRFFVALEEKANHYDLEGPVGPGNLVDSEEREADYHDQKSQLNEQRVWNYHVGPKQVLGPPLAHVRPGDLVDNEEWEADYHDQKLQLNEQRVRDCHVGPKHVLGIPLAQVCPATL
jgi:hypothetical protein